jgi:tryptophan 2,3-dioxygenase
MDKPDKPLYYSDYLQLAQLLSSQKLKSIEHGKPAHDEMLFIIVHQTYELWFKLIIHEIDSVMDMFKADTVDEKSIGTAVFRLQRVTEVEKLLIDQLRILETMTPLDFLDFRDYLIPASGFQSFQFRIIENKLGLKSKQRLLYNNTDYYSTLSEQHQKIIMETINSESLLEQVEKWLERTPFLKIEGFDFWQSYRTSVDKMLANEKQIIASNPSLSEEKRKFQLEGFEATKESFEALFDEEKHNKLVQEGKRKLSYKATLAVLFINLYREEPIIHMPFRFLNLLADVDELFSTWRYRHALMVHRMIGSKVGTGGSTGHKYLAQTIERHRFFPDLFELATYLIPRSALPKLPENIKKQLGFYYTYK